VADLLQRSAQEFYTSLVQSLDFAQDLSRIAEFAHAMYLPDAVAPGAIIPQFDGYFTLEDIPIKALLARKLQPNEYLGGGNGLATTTQILKQADVVLMLYLFSERYPLETKVANWEFYEPRTEHGSSLSACSYSLIASEIGKVEWAYRYFMKTATIDLTGEGKQYVGTLYIGGTHAAGSGGAWMAAVFGLCGIRCSGETIAINPHLPTHWRQITLPFAVRGETLRITLSHDGIAVRSEKPLAVSLSVTVGASTYPLPSTGELVISTTTAGR
jgi:trehalose/maltose hydrolase-like predicted phosphorylase